MRGMFGVLLAPVYIPNSRAKLSFVVVVFSIFVLQCTGHAGRCNFCIENETIEMSDDYQPYFRCYLSFTISIWFICCLWYFIVASQARLSPSVADG